MQQLKNKDPYLLFLGKKFTLARHMRGEGQEAVARAAGISQPLLSNIDNGAGESLNILLIIKLAVYLDIPWNDLAPPN